MAYPKDWGDRRGKGYPNRVRSFNFLDQKANSSGICKPSGGTIGGFSGEGRGGGATLGDEEWVLFYVMTWQISIHWIRVERFRLIVPSS